MREPDVPAKPADEPAGLDHDLINSLASIRGFSQILRDNPALPEDLRHSAELLAKEAIRTQHLVQRLLDIVRDRPPRRVPDVASSVEALEPARHDPAPSTATTTRPRVLVLDDEPTFRLFLEKALALLGYEPVITSQSQEAVDRAGDGDLAVLLFDHQMPGVSGVEAYEALVATRPDLAPRLVLMSGGVLDPGLEAFASKNGVRLLAKPFELDTLDGTIRAVMAATGQLRG